MIGLTDGGIESSDATESRGKGDVAHRQSGFIDELFCKMQAAGMSHGDRRRSEMLEKKAAEMARADSEMFGENFDATVFESAFTDEPQRP